MTCDFPWISSPDTGALPHTCLCLPRTCVCTCPIHSCACIGCCGQSACTFAPGGRRRLLCAGTSTFTVGPVRLQIPVRSPRASCPWSPLGPGSPRPCPAEHRLISSGATGVPASDSTTRLSRDCLGSVGNIPFCPLECFQEGCAVSQRPAPMTTCRGVMSRISVGNFLALCYRASGK